MGVKDVFKQGWSYIDKRLDKFLDKQVEKDLDKSGYRELQKAYSEHIDLFAEKASLKIENAGLNNKIELLELEKDNEKSIFQTEIEHLKLENQDLKFENQWLRDQLPKFKRDVEFLPFDMEQDSQEMDR